MGDTGGVMAYSNGSNNVFLNLSSSSANAAATDYLSTGSGGVTNLKVTYAVPGGNGTSTTSTATISTGGTSGYANTAQGLISAVNNAGLGLTATFATQAQAGVQGGGLQTGIEITGGLISAGVDPSGSSTSGTLNLSGLAAGATLAQGSKLTITDGATTYGQITIDSTNDTLATLATAIGTNTSNAVTAKVITNGDGTQSLSLSDVAGGGALSVATAAGTTQTATFAGVGSGVGTTGSTVAIQSAANPNGGTAAVTGAASTLTINDGGTDTAATQLTLGSSITINNSIANDNQSQTFIVGSGTNNTPAGTYYTGNTDAGGTHTSTLGQLADAINAQSTTLGVYATIANGSLTLTTGSYVSGNYDGATPAAVVGTPTQTTGQVVSVSSNSLTTSTTNSQFQLYTPQVGGATAGTPNIVSLGDNTGTAAGRRHSDGQTHAHRSRRFSNHIRPRCVERWHQQLHHSDGRN